MNLTGQTGKKRAAPKKGHRSKSVECLSFYVIVKDLFYIIMTLEEPQSLGAIAHQKVLCLLVVVEHHLVVFTPHT